MPNTTFNFKTCFAKLFGAKIFWRTTYSILLNIAKKKLTPDIKTNAETETKGKRNNSTKPVIKTSFSSTSNFNFVEHNYAD